MIADCQLALFTSRLQMRDEARARRRSSASRGLAVRGDRRPRRAGARVALRRRDRRRRAGHHGRRAPRRCSRRAASPVVLRARAALGAHRLPERAHRVLRADADRAARGGGEAARGAPAALPRRRVRPRFEATRRAVAAWPVAVHAREGRRRLLIASRARRDDRRAPDRLEPARRDRAPARARHAPRHLPGDGPAPRRRPRVLRNAIEAEVSATEPALFRLRP